jgi:hypothetical protein
MMVGDDNGGVFFSLCSSCFLFVMFVVFIVFLSSCLTCSQACAQIPSHHFFCTLTFKLLVVAFFCHCIFAFSF